MRIALQRRETQVLAANSTVIDVGFAATLIHPAVRPEMANPCLPPSARQGRHSLEAWAATSMPILCSVINPHDFDGLLSEAVNGYIRRRRKQNLAGAILQSRPSPPWSLFQTADSVVQLSHGRVAVARMMLCKVIANALQVRCGGRRTRIL